MLTFKLKKYCFNFGVICLVNIFNLNQTSTFFKQNENVNKTKMGRIGTPKISISSSVTTGIYGIGFRWYKDIVVTPRSSMANEKTRFYSGQIGLQIS